jgi:biopolymer transport protein ExbB
MLRTTLLSLLLLLAAPSALVAQETEAPAAPPASTAPVGPSALERAYQKEVAFLLSERAALQTRLATSQADGEARIAAAHAAIDAAQGRLLALQREADAAEQLLDRADDGSRRALESGDLLGSTLEQARTSLSDLGATPPAPAESGEAPAVEAPVELGAAFARMQSLIDDGGRIRTEPGAFFLADGTRTEGQVVRVGRIASYGVSPAGTGALAPAGQGRLRLAPQGGAEVASSLARGGSTPAVAGVFLHESLAQAFEERTGRTVQDVIDAGGPVGLVILGLGAIALLLVLIRGFSLWTLGRSAEATLEAIRAPLAAADFAGAAAAAAAVKGTGSRVAGAVLAARHRAHDALEDIASEALLGAEPALQRFGTPIAVIAAVTPLLGLLGTVTGMIATFEVITNVGTGNPKLLSGGISEALVTTQLGLVVAIPALLLGNLLSARAERVREQLEQGALATLNALGAAHEASARATEQEPDFAPAGEPMVLAAPRAGAPRPGAPVAVAPAPEVASA